MDKRSIYTIVLVLSIVFVTALIAGEKHTYVGVKTCKMCHKGERKGMVFEKWEGSEHANATAQLEGQEVTDKCYGCHATGFGEEGGFAPDCETTETMAGIQCEACHGPGSDYKKMKIMKDPEAAKAAGLKMPAPEHCTTCHNNSHHADMIFNYEEAWPQIEHKLPEGE